MITLKRVADEAYRRSLAGAGNYAVGSWVVLQVDDVLAEHLGLPKWTMPLAFILMIIGLPIVLATAFVQEVSGIKLDSGYARAIASGGLALPAGAIRVVDVRFEKAERNGRT